MSLLCSIPLERLMADWSVEVKDRLQGGVRKVLACSWMSYDIFLAEAETLTRFIAAQSSHCITQMPKQKTGCWV